MLIVAPAAPAAGYDGLVFAGFDGSGWDLWETGADGTPERLTRGRDASHPAAAVDGRIAFADAAGFIWIRDRDGDTSAVPGVPAPCAHPAWSPDGRRLAFACFRFHQRMDDGAIWVSDAGGAPRAIYDGPGLQKSPAWSPDGRRLAFVSGFRLTPTRVVEHIWVLDLDTGDARALVEGDGAAINPAWSPDGNRLAFASDRTGNLELWVLELRTGAARPITVHDSYDDEPAWSPGGERIAFQSTRGGEMEVWEIPVAGGEARRRIGRGAGGLARARSPQWRDPGSASR